MENKTILDYLGDSTVQVSVLIVLLVFYLITRNPWFGALTLIAMISFLIIEFYVGSKSHGIKKELIETVGAFLLAFIVWEGMIFILNTPSPMSAVVSCSMVDYINRGDMIIVKGEDEYNSAYTLEVSKRDIEELNKLDAYVLYDNREYKIKGSLFSLCQNSYDEICKDFVENPERFKEIRGNFEFQYGKCDRYSTSNNVKIKEPCLVSFSYKGKAYNITKKGDVVVYTPKRADLFYSMLGGGDIIHRAIIKLKADGKNYYITKGDNNNVADFQFYSQGYGKKNSIVEEEQVKGKMIGKIPFLGYYKLFLIGSFEEGNLCSFILEW